MEKGTVNSLERSTKKGTREMSKPVAWMSNGKEFYVQKNYCPDFIPLYTHPVKEQDESFDRTASHMAGEYVSWTSCVACGQRVTGDSIHTCSPQLKELTDEEITVVFVECLLPDGEFDEHEFARAILRKASEK